MHNPIFDSREFRQTLGCFPTGVTIITCLTATGEPVGMTASSFNSVSLDPPLVLWSIDKRALSLQAFTQAKHYAIHVLAGHQQDLSNQFARQGADKFSGVSVTEGIAGVPLLTEYCARFQCQTEHQYEGGDHIILVGRVLDFKATEYNPLLFHRGRYALLEEAALA
jgi:flavin reductase (DIM6/NTAB) family NADH-FMN oxidoreductase RutF